MISVFDYIDYKKYLSDWRCEEKKKHPGMTHEYLCYKLGRKNRSLFNDIEKGRKKIGSELLLRLIKLLKLKNDEIKYFKAIVNFGQETNYKEKEYWFEQIINLNNTPKKTIDLDSYSYFKEWYHTTIRAMLDIFNFKNDYKFFAQKIYNRITVSQVKESITLLKKLKLISKNQDGYLKPNDKVVATKKSFNNKILNKYLITNNEFFTEILKKDEPGTYESSIFTLSLSPKGFEQVMQRVNQFKKEISSIAHKDEEEANRVYKIAVHAYPEIKPKENI